MSDPVVVDKTETFSSMLDANQQRHGIEPAALKNGNGSGNSGGMNPPTMKDYVDARDAQNLSEMKSEFEKLRADIAKLPTTWVMLGLFVGAVGLILSALAFGGARFTAGISMADVRQAQLQRDADQDASVKEITSKLDQLIAAQRPAKEGKPH